MDSKRIVICFMMTLRPRNVTQKTHLSSDQNINDTYKTKDNEANIDESLSQTHSVKTMNCSINEIADSLSICSDKSCAQLTSQKRSENECCSRHTIVTAIFKLFICLVCGIVFGIMFVKSRVFEPKSIRGQMVFESFIMLKMFLSAVCSGQIVFSILSLLPSTQKYFKDAVNEYTDCFKEKGIFTSVVGALILGCGMTLSGACPGMVLAQVGSWVPNSIFTLLGCFFGALTYGLSARFIHKYTKPKNCLTLKTVDQYFSLPFIAIALPMSVILFIVIFILEYYWDYTKDLGYINRQLQPYSNIVTAIAWRPSIAGAIIGLIQLPLVLIVRDTMGGSSSYVTIISQWVITKRLQKKLEYLANKRCGLGNWWQVVFVSGAIVGAALASIASNTIATSLGPNVQTAFVGGTLMLWGARLAAGCTSGHGLSGMGLLARLSFIAVPCMFIGGIVTAFSMKATGTLHDYVNATLDTQ